MNEQQLVNVANQAVNVWLSCMIFRHSVTLSYPET